MDKKHNIMIVDDEVTILDMITLAIRSMDGECEIYAYSDCYEALEYYQYNRDKIDILLVDYNMPQMNGVEFLIEMKKINSKIRALLFTGGGIEDQDVMWVGFEKVLRKPITIDTLKAVIFNNPG